MRLVLDTNVVASGIYWPGPPRLLLQAARDKQIQIFTSTPMLIELADVLARAKFENKCATLKLPLEELASRYADLAGVVVPQTVPRIAPDPDDDVVIGTALAARASIIVTGDKPLQSVIRYQNVEIISTALALQRIAA
jgi:uncharacterized protein